MNVKKWIFLLILLVVLGGGGFGIYKYAFKDKQSKNTSSNENSGAPTNPGNDNPQPNPSGKLSEAELEKYLLEKRLDLQKYFVFNLGKEVKANPGATNAVRELEGNLSNDLTKLATNCEKKVKEKGYELFLGKIGNYTYFRKPREVISFVKKDWDIPSPNSE